MAQVQKTVLLEFSSEQMFNLVDAVERYPEFLPWCNRSEVAFRSEQQTVATVHIDFKAIKSHFTTRNDKERFRSMKIALVDGPFRRLDGFWAFTSLDEQACKVEFSLHYEFSSRLLEKIIGPVFFHITSTFVDAFVKRAREVYGIGHV